MAMLASMYIGINSMERLSRCFYASVHDTRFGKTLTPVYPSKRMLERPTLWSGQWDIPYNAGLFSPPLLILIDQSVGRSVVRINQFIIPQFRKDFPGQLFAKFHTPLVEAENIPDDTLHKYLMFIKRNQRT